MPPAAPRIPHLPAELTLLLGQVPPGAVTTYGTLADALGHRGAARWVGEWMVDHPHDAACPCHRVVRQGGHLGLYITGDVAEKARRLQAEGVDVQDQRVLPSIAVWNQFTGTQPLARLVEFQNGLPHRVRLRPLADIPELIAGLDVSYASNGYGVAAYALVETATRQLVWSHVLARPVTFPYISGLLAFRELPLHLELLEEVRAANRLAPLLFVDGHGRLHPRRAGIATHLGVLTGRPTLGIGKKLLCGRVDQSAVRPGRPQPILHNDEPVGMAVQASQSSRPVFVSPGQNIDLPSAVRAVEQLFANHRVPEPIYHADALSRQAARRLS